MLGGTYGNLEATEALRRVAGERDIPPSQTICTGDVGAYGADPQAAVDLIRDWGCAVVTGNCEEALAADAADRGCGCEDGTAGAALAAQGLTDTRRDLNPDAKRSL